MVKTKSRLLSLVLVFFVAFAAMWTINLDTTYAATKKIHLKKTTITVTEGKTYQQKLIDKKGKTISATKVKWKSLKTSVAKISKKGKITAIKPGTAKMTAKYKGKTYKFTVKVKASPYNTYIGVDQPSVELRVGQSKTLIVYTDKGEDIAYDCNNGNVDCEWGDWFNGGVDSYFYVTGVRPGTSTITVYDDHNKNVSATIRVTVTNPTYTLSDLYNYIQKNGDVDDDDGTSYIVGRGAGDDDFALFENVDNNTVRFSYLMGDKLYVTMDMVLPQTSSTKPIVMVKASSGTMLGTATMYVSTYNTDKDLTFSNAGGDLAVNQQLCNSGLKLAMTTWELNLHEYGFSFSDFGFKNF